jgi:hypothetical protein
MNRPLFPAVAFFTLTTLTVFSAENPRSTATPSAASALRESLPTFASPTPATKPATPKGEATSVVMMDPLIVTGPKLPTFREWQLLTKEQQAAFLKRRYPGAVVPLADPMSETVPNYAATMLRDDTRQENLRDLQSTAELYRLGGDAEGAKKIKLETQKSLIRRSDWRTEGMDRSYNNGRR